VDPAQVLCPGLTQPDEDLSGTDEVGKENRNDPGRKHHTSVVELTPAGTVDGPVPACPPTSTGATPPLVERIRQLTSTWR
jgi:hypothetical protein